MRQQGNYLDTLGAARHLGLSTRTLRRYRASGGGPAIHRFGGLVRYLRADLDDWAATRRRGAAGEEGSGYTEGGRAEATLGRGQALDVGAGWAAFAALAAMTGFEPGDSDAGRIVASLPGSSAAPVPGASGTRIPASPDSVRKAARA